MPPALTPALALDYVRELSADVRAAVVLGATGELLAGPERLAGPARALLDAGGDAAELEAGVAGGIVCAVRSPAHAAIAVCGRHAIGAVVRTDLRAALAALAGRPPEAGAPPGAGAPQDAAAPSAGAAETAPDAALTTAAEALISAVQRLFEA